MKEFAHVRVKSHPVSYVQLDIKRRVTRARALVEGKTLSIRHGPVAVDPRQRGDTSRSMATVSVAIR